MLSRQYEKEMKEITFDKQEKCFSNERNLKLCFAEMFHSCNLRRFI